MLVSAMIDSWQAGSFSPVMVVRESIGQAGEIQVETKVSYFVHARCDRN